MSAKQLFVVFGGFGLFLGSIGAVQLFVTSRGQIVPSLLMLVVGLVLGLLGGVFRLVQLRYSEAARQRLAADSQVASPTNWIRLWIGTLLFVLPLAVTRALRAPAVVEFSLMTILLALILVQLYRRSRR
jgi:hypothetical protein